MSRTVKESGKVTLDMSRTVKESGKVTLDMSRTVKESGKVTTSGIELTPKFSHFWRV